MISGSVLSSDGTRSSIETLYYSTEAQDKNMNKTPFWLVFPVIAVLGLTACGGDDDGEKEEAEEIVEPIGDTDDGSSPSGDDSGDDSGDAGPARSAFELEVLPAVNTSLSVTSPAGVWMLTSSQTSAIPNEEDATNPFQSEQQGREMVVITENEEGFYEVTRCASDWRNDAELVETDDGYSWTEVTVEEADEGVAETTKTRFFDVSYSSDFQTLTATGTYQVTPVGEDLSLTMTGVKISDSTDFNNAADLTFSYSLDYVNLGTAGNSTEGALQCVGAFNSVRTTESESDVWTFEQREYSYFNTDNEQVRYYRFDQNVEGTETRTLGAIIQEADQFAILLTNCDITNTDCMAAAQWAEDVVVNDASVSFDVRFDVVDNTYVFNPMALIPFFSFLWPHDGDYFHSEIEAAVIE